MARIQSLRIQGYRPFRDFIAPLGPLEVIVGANGSGKSALFEFLQFIRDSLSHDSIDEPDQGVHPRTLPILAGLFQKASARTQILLATHASYFLSLFDLSEIAIMRKVGGAAQFLKPNDSQVLVDMLGDFGSDELERLHRSDELERLP